MGAQIWIGPLTETQAGVGVWRHPAASAAATLQGQGQEGGCHISELINELFPSTSSKEREKRRRSSDCKQISVNCDASAVLWIFDYSVTQLIGFLAFTTSHNKKWCYVTCVVLPKVVRS